MHLIVPLRGLCQELHIIQEAPTPLYMDSMSTLYVALDRAAVKKSVWLRRRAGILQDGVDHLEISPLKIEGTINPADAETKYLPFEVWRKLLEYSNNFGAGAGA